MKTIINSTNEMIISGKIAYGQNKITAWVTSSCAGSSDCEEEWSPNNDALSIDGVHFPLLFKDITNGTNVMLRYEISSEPIDTSEEAVVRREIMKQVGTCDGELTSASGLIIEGYSEYTIDSIYIDKESLIVGGHDLVEEFKNWDGYYCAIYIKWNYFDNGNEDD